MTKQWREREREREMKMFKLVYENCLMIDAN